MAGAFGYGADTIDVSLAMGELSLLPAVRAAPADALIVADGTSCRHQIKDGAAREALARRPRSGDEHRGSSVGLNASYLRISRASGFGSSRGPKALNRTFSPTVIQWAFSPKMLRP